MPIVPQEMVTRIGRAHLAGQRVLVDSGLDAAESVDVALAVEAHRWFWMPDTVRTLLVAESHILTTQAELGCRVKCQWLKVDGRAAPNSFVRSPYCIGYGEPDLAPGIPKEDNLGNWQYWDLFGELAETGDVPDRKASLAERLEWKARTLVGLRDRGIWMMDASLHGRPAKDAAEIQLVPKFYRTWWEGYGQAVWEEEHQPKIVVIGRGLYRALTDAQIPATEWLYLPAGLREAEQKAHQDSALKKIRRLSSIPHY